MADEQDKIQVKITFRIPPGRPSVYAHHMLIQPGESEVVLSFFELVPPIFIQETPEERAERIKETGIIADCVARVTIALDRFPLFASAMMETAERVKKVEKQTEQTDADNPDNQG